MNFCTKPAKQLTRYGDMSVFMPQKIFTAGEGDLELKSGDHMLAESSGDHEYMQSLLWQYQIIGYTVFT